MLIYYIKVVCVTKKKITVHIVMQFYPEHCITVTCGKKKDIKYCGHESVFFYYYLFQQTFLLDPAWLCIAFRNI